MNIDEVLFRLSYSKFRSSFHLKENDIKYIEDKGWSTVERHAHDFIEKRLAPAHLPNDGKQTPYRGHPVFISQHATGTCCRSCLYKWYHLSKNRSLTKSEQDYVVKVIMKWLKREYDNYYLRR